MNLGICSPYSGNEYFLHRRIGKHGNMLYYFSRSAENAIPIPDDREACFVRRNGIPYLRRKAVING